MEENEHESTGYENYLKGFVEADLTRRSRVSYEMICDETEAGLVGEEVAI